MGQTNTLANFRCPSDPASDEKVDEYTSCIYWPGEWINLLLPDYDSTERAAEAATRLFYNTPNATVFIDRKRWHPAKKRHAVFMPDWHAGVYR